MKSPPANVLELPLIERAEMALKAAVEKVMEEHAREGYPVYILRGDEIVEISAEELRTRYPRNPQES
jgi:NurA-like 5'-3' nuclease